MIQSFGGHRFCSPEYKAFKQDMELQMYSRQGENLKQYRDYPLSLAVYFHNNRFWRKKDGALRLRYDVSKHLQSGGRFYFQTISRLMIAGMLSLGLLRENRLRQRKSLHGSQVVFITRRMGEIMNPLRKKEMIKYTSTH